MKLKRILIPAFFVIDIGADEPELTAEVIACRMQEAANDLEPDGIKGEHFLMLDEILPNRTVAVTEEYPHSFNGPIEVDTEQADEPTCTCGSRLFNDKGDCQICGL